MSDDDLKDYDLSAWDAPAPPIGLADGVLARMTATDAAIAVALQRRGTRRWWIAGGVAAAAAVASLALWIALRTPDHGDATGAVIATAPEHLELGATSANLDRGAYLKWWRTGSTLHVEQAHGGATWLVGGDDHLVIDAGATVATVDATGASLRVEVSMNMTDVRVIGASAATAAAVAMVTVVVYEGHVKATGGGQTMVVVPGTTVEVKPGQPPHEPANVGASVPLPSPTAPGAELALPAGESAMIHDPRGRTVVQFMSHCRNRTELAITPPIDVADNVGTLTVGHYSYQIRCDGNRDPSALGTLDVVEDAGTAAVDPGGDPTNASLVGSIDLPIDGAAWPDPVHVVGDTTSGSLVSVAGKAVIVDSNAHFAGDLLDHPTTLAIRISDDARGVHYYMRRAGSGKDVTVRDPLPPDSCDEVSCVLDDYEGKCCAKFLAHDSPEKAAVDKVIADARPKIDACRVDDGAWGTVQVKLRIGGDGKVFEVTVMSAPDQTLGTCVAEVLQTLRFAKSKRGGQFTIPFAFPPSKSQKTSSCDANALVTAGTNSEAMGAHAQALKQFEDALKCKPDDAHAIALSFMAACNASNVAKARVYWRRMPPDAQNARLQMCIRVHITREMLDAR
jgi:hypothetical protein